MSRQEYDRFINDPTAKVATVEAFRTDERTAFERHQDGDCENDCPHCTNGGQG